MIVLDGGKTSLRTYVLRVITKLKLSQDAK